MIETAQFLYQQSPVFWYALAGVFLLFGFVYALVAWRSYKYRLHSAQREKSQLLREREKAIADRHRRRQLRDQHSAREVAVPSQSTNELRSQNSSANTNPLVGFATHLHKPNGTAPVQSNVSSSGKNEAPNRGLHPDALAEPRNGYAKGTVNETDKDVDGQQPKPPKLTGLFSTNYQSRGPAKKGTTPQ